MGNRASPSLWWGPDRIRMEGVVHQLFLTPRNPLQRQLYRDLKLDGLEAAASSVNTVRQSDMWLTD